MRFFTHKIIPVLLAWVSNSSPKILCRKMSWPLSQAENSQPQHLFAQSHPTYLTGKISSTHAWPMHTWQLQQVKKRWAKDLEIAGFWLSKTLFSEINLLNRIESEIPTNKTILPFTSSLDYMHIYIYRYKYVCVYINIYIYTVYTHVYCTYRFLIKNGIQSMANEYLKTQAR